MATLPRSSAPHGRRSGLARLGLLTAAAGLAMLLRGNDSAAAFTGATVGRRAAFDRVAALAESEAAPAPGGDSMALVKVTDENAKTTASLVGGALGLLLGGVWVGGALFAATSYLTRKEDDDISKALKGVASAGLEAINFGAAMNDKYTVTGKIGGAFTDVVSKAKTDSTKDTFAQAEGVVDNIKGAIKSVDDDIGIKDTIGTLATSASDLAYQAVDKVVDLEKQYKVTDQIKEKIDEVTKSAGSAKTA